MTIPNTRYSIPNTTQLGFTLVETMVAISILLIAVVGPMSTIGGSLSQIRTARDQVIAVNLAQEGIEVVRQIRDSNLLQRWKEGSMDWNTEYVFASATTAWNANMNNDDYIVAPLGATPSARLVALGADTVVYLDVHGFFTQGGGGTKTQFSRIVNISGTGSERLVTATVTWKTSGGDTKSVVVSEHIFGINN